jgi:hypothetical protein
MHPTRLTLLALAACTADPLSHGPQPGATSNPPLASTPIDPDTSPTAAPHTTIRTLASADAVIYLADLLPPAESFYPVSDGLQARSDALSVHVRPEGTSLHAGTSTLRLSLAALDAHKTELRAPVASACPAWHGEACTDAASSEDPALGVEATWSLLSGVVEHSYVLHHVQASQLTLRFSTNAAIEPAHDGLLLFTPDGEVWHHSTALAWDAKGGEVEAAVERCGDDVCVHLEGDPSAAPWTVDPTLTPPDVDIYGSARIFGAFMAAGGDIDGDGFGDLIISETEQAYVFYGSPGNVDPQSLGVRLGTPNWNWYSIPVDGGDVNGDGYSDVVMSAWDEWAMVFHSRAGGLRGTDEASDVTVNAVGSQSGFGVALALADFNGDGFDDLVISDTGPGAFNSTIDIWPGSANGIAVTSPFPRPEHLDRREQFWGHELSTGDVNGDGFADLLVSGGGPIVSDLSTGAPNPALYLGSAFGLHTQPAWLAGSLFSGTNYEPWKAVIAPDVDGDGFDDLLFAGVGRIWWLRGDARGVEDHEPRLMGSWLGNCVSQPGCPRRRVDVAGTSDVNGDGFGDVAVTYDGDTSGTSPVGRVAVVAGGPEGPMAHPMWILDAQTTDPTFSVAHRVDDLNGDGLAEVGAAYPLAYRPGTSPSWKRGAIALWNGREEPDIDVDGYPEPDDCHPYHPSAHPGATEIPGNLLDDDCDGTLLCYLDLDLDGTAGTTTAAFPAGTVCADVGAFHTADDCHDTDPQLGPHAAELPHDNVDQDCDGYVACTADLDGDGFGGPSPQLLLATGCSTAPETTTDTSDCDDADPDSYPGAPEVIADGIDQDCDGLFTCWVDEDLDGYGDGLRWFPSSSATCPGGTTLAGDCDDTDPLFHPAINETVDNPLDEDCDGLLACWADNDQDGWGGEVVQLAATDCQSAPEPTARQPGDCRDNLPGVYPGATEVAGNNRDEDCNGTMLCYVDADLDGFGSSFAPPVEVPYTLGVNNIVWNCYDHVGHSGQSTDCDDTDWLVRPGREELPGNQTDENCDTYLSCYADDDLDGHPGTTTFSVPLASQCPPDALTATDCDDSTPHTSPSATEVAGNSIDEDCNGLLTCYFDADRDGYGSSTLNETSAATCHRPNNQRADDNLDCNDNLANLNPAAREIRQDGIDQDCDGVDNFALWVHPTNPAPGDLLTLDVRGADPGASLWFVRSTQGQGPGPCPALLAGTCANVRSPQLLVASTATPNGTQLLTRTLPLTLAPGTQVWFQVFASNPGGPALRSQVVSIVVGP